MPEIFQDNHYTSIAEHLWINVFTLFYKTMPYQIFSEILLLKDLDTLKER